MQTGNVIELKPGESFPLLTPQTGYAFPSVEFPAQSLGKVSKVHQAADTLRHNALSAEQLKAFEALKQSPKAQDKLWSLGFATGVTIRMIAPGPARAPLPEAPLCQAIRNAQNGKIA